MGLCVRFFCRGFWVKLRRNFRFRMQNLGMRERVKKGIGVLEGCGFEPSMMICNLHLASAATQAFFSFLFFNILFLIYIYIYSYCK